MNTSLPQILYTGPDTFHRCIETGTIPPSRRQSVIKILFKEKRDTKNENKYKGTAVEYCPFEVLNRLFTKGLQAIITLLPYDNQLHATFTHHTMTFNIGKKTLIMRKRINKSQQQTHIIRNTPKHKDITICNNLSISDYFRAKWDASQTLPKSHNIQYSKCSRSENC
jgi:hypothetical protein